MKKLNQIVLKNSLLISSEEMKLIKGGSFPCPIGERWYSCKGGNVDALVCATSENHAFTITQNGSGGHRCEPWKPDYEGI